MYFFWAFVPKHLHVLCDDESKALTIVHKFRALNLVKPLNARARCAFGLLGHANTCLSSIIRRSDKSEQIFAVPFDKASRAPTIEHLHS